MTSGRDKTDYGIIQSVCTHSGSYDTTCTSFKKLSSKSSREDMCRLPTSFLLNIQSRVKQEVAIAQIPNCVTRYSSPY